MHHKAMAPHLYNFSTKLSTCLVKELVLLVLLVTNILPQCRCLASSSSSSKFGVHVIRSPESTIAPQGDEVQFECELSLVPERLEWRFLPQDRLGDNQHEYTYMNINVSMSFRSSLLFKRKPSEEEVVDLTTTVVIDDEMLEVATVTNSALTDIFLTFISFHRTATMSLSTSASQSSRLWSATKQLASIVA